MSVSLAPSRTEIYWHYISRYSQLCRDDGQGVQVGGGQRTLRTVWRWRLRLYLHRTSCQEAAAVGERDDDSADPKEVIFSFEEQWERSHFQRMGNKTSSAPEETLVFKPSVTFQSPTFPTSAPARVKPKPVKSPSQEEEEEKTHEYTQVRPCNDREIPLSPVWHLPPRRLKRIPERGYRDAFICSCPDCPYHDKVKKESLKVEEPVPLGTIPTKGFENKCKGRFGFLSLQR